jgi:hypothetical protein
MKTNVFTIDKRSHIKKAQEIYDKIKANIESNHKGEIIAIDPESGDYFLGKTVIDAVMKGREKYPDRVFHSIRIGYSAVYVRR